MVTREWLYAAARARAAVAVLEGLLTHQQAEVYVERRRLALERETARRAG